MRYTDMAINSEGAYLQWLSNVAVIQNNVAPERSKSLLVEQLHRKEFIWSVPYDDNRVYDAMELRRQFQMANDGVTLLGIPSLLEIMIVLAMRLDFELGEESENLSREEAIAYWFDILLDNIGLGEYTDEVYLNDYSTSARVDRILDRVILRRYGPDGVGGFFPLVYPREDQRCVELWFQMSAYVLERSGHI